MMNTWELNKMLDIGKMYNQYMDVCWKLHNAAWLSGALFMDDLDVLVSSHKLTDPDRSLRHKVGFGVWM